MKSKLISVCEKCCSGPLSTLYLPRTHTTLGGRRGRPLIIRVGGFIPSSSCLYVEVSLQQDTEPQKVPFNSCRERRMYASFDKSKWIKLKKINNVFIWQWICGVVVWLMFCLVVRLSKTREGDAPAATYSAYPHWVRSEGLCVDEYEDIYACTRRRKGRNHEWWSGAVPLLNLHGLKLATHGETPHGREKEINSLKQLLE